MLPVQVVGREKCRPADVIMCKLFQKVPKRGTALPQSRNSYSNTTRRLLPPILRKIHVLASQRHLSHVAFVYDVVNVKGLALSGHQFKQPRRF